MFEHILDYYRFRIATMPAGPARLKMWEAVSEYFPEHLF
jgi:hypothetical protein